MEGCGLRSESDFDNERRELASAREGKSSEPVGRIRVLHLIDSLELGGAQTALLAWLTSHDRSRFEVHLASMHGTRKSLYYERAEKLGIPVIFLSPRRFVPIYLLRLPLLMLRRRYEVVHCHLFASNWLGKPFARLLGVPVVISHDQCNDSFRTNSTLVTLIDRLTNRCADQIFAVSASVKDYLIAFEKVSSARIRIIPNGLPDRVQSRRTRGFAQGHWRRRKARPSKKLRSLSSDREGIDGNR